MARVALMVPEVCDGTVTDNYFISTWKRIVRHYF
jgi:hypothetical protein